MERFVWGLPDPQEAKVVTECLYCGGEIYEGEKYKQIAGEDYCDSDCFAESVGAITKTAGEE